MEIDLQHSHHHERKRQLNIGFQLSEHPFLLINAKSRRLRRMLNKEQQAITKDISMKKRMDMYKALYLFLIGGAGTGKTFTAKVIFQMLMKLYDAHHSTDPLKPKGFILAYTGNAAYNASGTIVHSVLLMPFNKFAPTPLSNETLDALGKLYEELRLVFIDEVSLLGS